jgi:hypothetical protein
MAEEHTIAAIAEGPHHAVAWPWRVAGPPRRADQQGRRLGRSRQDPGRAGNLTTITVTRPMGLPRHRQPHRLVGDGSLAYLARGHGVVSVRQ